MSWPTIYREIVDALDRPFSHAWQTAPELASHFRWSTGKTNYWLNKMIADRWIVWRWHPRRHGWHATRQYGTPWRTKGL